MTSNDFLKELKAKDGIISALQSERDSLRAQNADLLSAVANLRAELRHQEAHASRQLARLQTLEHEQGKCLRVLLQPADALKMRLIIGQALGCSPASLTDEAVAAYIYDSFFTMHAESTKKHA